MRARYEAYCDASRVTSIIATGQLGDHRIRQMVIDARPDEIIGRKSKPLASDVFSKYLPGVHIWNIDTESQFRLQKKYFGVAAYIGLVNSPKISKKVFRIGRWLFGRGEIFGCSTGLWSVVYALEENPEATVYVSGVGLQGGSHWYRDGVFNDDTAMKDRILAPRLPEREKRRVKTTDPVFSELVGVELVEGFVLD